MVAEPDPGPGGQGSQAHAETPQCCWQSSHREMHYDNLTAGWGPASGQSKKAVDPTTSPHGIHKAWGKARVLYVYRMAGTEQLSLTEDVGLAHTGPEL